jgi:hypothetical protein
MYSIIVANYERTTEREINVIGVEIEGENLVIYGNENLRKEFLTLSIEFGFGFGQDDDRICWVYIPIDNIRKLTEV